MNWTGCPNEEKCLIMYNPLCKGHNTHEYNDISDEFCPALLLFMQESPVFVVTPLELVALPDIRCYYLS